MRPEGRLLDRQGHREPPCPFHGFGRSRIFGRFKRSAYQFRIIRRQPDKNGNQKSLSQHHRPNRGQNFHRAHLDLPREDPYQLSRSRGIRALFENLQLPLDLFGNRGPLTLHHYGKGNLGQQGRSGESAKNRGDRFDDPYRHGLGHRCDRARFGVLPTRLRHVAGARLNPHRRSVHALRVDEFVHPFALAGVP